MKKITKILIVVILVFVLLICISKSRKKNLNGNIANMGLVVDDKGIVYYNKYEKGIFAVENGKEKQITDETAYSLNVYKNKIYYLSIADFSNVVIKSVDKNGENRKNIATIYTSISKIYVVDGYIYYSTNKKEKGIVKIDLNGENETVILEENVQDFQVVNKDIFYINNSNQICKISISGQDNCVLNNEINANKIQVVDKWIYYYDKNENALFRLMNNGKKQELISVLVQNEIYNVSEKYVYYLDKENSKIARMKIGKSNKCDDIVDINISKTKINIAGDILYYLDKSSDESQTYQMYRVKVNGDKIDNIEY